jgi:hypothetical protein
LKSSRIAPWRACNQESNMLELILNFFFDLPRTGGW